MIEEIHVKLIKNPDTKFWDDFDILINKTVRHKVQQNSIWLKAYTVSYLKNKNIFILSAYIDSELVGCMPLQIVIKRATRFWNYRVLHILGYGPTDFYDIPIESGMEKSVLTSFFRYLKKNSSWDKLIITELPETTKAANVILTTAKKFKYKVLVDKPNGYYYIDTKNKEWADFRDSHFEKANKDLSKGLRRIKASGYELTTTSFTKNTYEMLCKHLKLYADRRQSLGQKNTYLTSERLSFLKTIMTQYENHNAVELTLLKDQNNTIWGFQLDWIRDNIRYHWNHAYNEDFKRYSPGKQLLKLLLERSFDNVHIYECNHMRGLAHYKTKFTDKKGYFLRVQIINNRSIRVLATRIISYILNFIKK